MANILKYFGNDLEPTNMANWLSSKDPALAEIAHFWFEKILKCSDEVMGIFHEAAQWPVLTTPLLLM